MDIKEKAKIVINSDEYALDITGFIPIKCKRAYICMAEKYEKDRNSFRLYQNAYVSKNEFEEYLCKKIKEIEKDLRNGSLSLDGEEIVIEFEDGSYISTSSSEWLYFSFGKE